MIVALTGATGRLGQRLLAALTARGDQVRCLVRAAPAGAPGSPPVPLFVGDLDPDRPAGALDEFLRGADVVLHAAALTRRARAAGTPTASKAAAPTRGDLLRVNRGGTARLLEACERVGGPAPRFVLVSTQSAVGPSQRGEPVRADAPCRPLSDYGVSKLEAERLTIASRLPWSIVRLPGLYGPGDESLLPAFRAARWGVRPAGSRHVPLLHQDDAVAALLLVSGLPAAAGRIVQAAAAPLTLTQCGRAIAAAVGRRALPVPLWTPWLRFIDAQRARELAGDWLIDGSALRELGFVARIAFADGARELAASYAAAGLL